MTHIFINFLEELTVPVYFLFIDTYNITLKKKSFPGSYPLSASTKKELEATKSGYTQQSPTQYNLGKLRGQVPLGRAR